MPRNMSFALTTDQFRAQTKTVTRRFGWNFLKPGDIVCGVEKGMGLKKGEKIKKLGLIRIKSVRSESLNAITKGDCIKEGFPEMEPKDFVKMICGHYKCGPYDHINRIEFQYLASLKKLKQDIMNNRDHAQFIMFGDRNKVKFGDFVISGLTQCGQHIIGYVVQIREGAGMFGSDMFFVREPDETLRTHENQGFWKLSDTQVEAIRPFFKVTPEEELEGNKDLEYSILDKYHAAGFIVSKDRIPEGQKSHFSLKTL